MFEIITTAWSIRNKCIRFDQIDQKYKRASRNRLSKAVWFTGASKLVYVFLSETVQDQYNGNGISLLLDIVWEVYGHKFDKRQRLREYEEKLLPAER